MDRDLYNFSKRASPCVTRTLLCGRGQFETLCSNDHIYAFARSLDDGPAGRDLQRGGRATEVTLDVCNLLPDGI